MLLPHDNDSVCQGQSMPRVTEAEVFTYLVVLRALCRLLEACIEVGPHLVDLLLDCLTNC